MDPLAWLTLAIVIALCLIALIWQARRKPPAPPGHDTVRAQLLEDARHQLLDHDCKAEYHESMADMLRSRIARLANKDAS